MDFILDSQYFIVDPETRKKVASIRCGKVFPDGEQSSVAVLVNSNLYDLNGDFLGRVDAGTCSLPSGLKRLLKDRGGPRNRSPSVRDSAEAPTPLAASRFVKLQRPGAPTGVLGPFQARQTPAPAEPTGTHGSQRRQVDAPIAMS